MSGIATPVFDLTEPLPRSGRLAVDASAGTGKTYTLAALACRYVAEADVPVGEMLVVTFTTAAAAELRERIRNRFVEAARALAESGTGLDHDDPVIAHLLRGAPTEVAERRARLERAVVEFDTATITTIHGFCARVLAAQGSTGRFDPSAVLVQDPSVLVGATVADVLVEAALEDAGSATTGPDDAGPDVVPLPKLPKLSRLDKLVATVLGNPGIVTVARSGAPDDIRTKQLVDLVIDRVHEQLVRTGGITFDEQLRRVAELLEDDPALRRSLSEQFAVAMIDESQDTDPVQWRALTTAFDGSSTVVVVVGDPKQSVYGFRGGDVHNYLAALGRSRRCRLDTNFRSDVAVIEAMNAMWTGVTLGHDDIAYEPVRSAPHLAGRSLELDGSPVPGLWIRSVTHPDQPRAKSGARSLVAGDARSTIDDDLANNVVALLDGGEVRSPDGRARLRADDIAVLVRAHNDAVPIQRSLLERGVASVIIGAGSVTRSLAASHWRWLIEALKRPADALTARAVALSWFFDVDAESVAASVSGADADGVGADALGAVQAALGDWVEVLRRQGVAAMVERVWRDGSVRERVLARPSGERDLTDLDHLAELLHVATSGRPIGPEGLAERFDALDDPDDDAVEDPEAIRRRVDSDTPAVRIMTIHVSKGLEFPVVCCPTLWGGSRVDSTSRIFHGDDGVRYIDVSGSAPDDVAELARRETEGELRRLTYVALTRALHTTLVWWAPTPGSDRSGLAHLLFGTGEDGRAAVPSNNGDAVEVLTRRVAERGADGVIRVEQVPFRPGRVARSGTTRHGSTPASETSHAHAGAITSGSSTQLDVARLGRVLDRTAGRWSFTSIAALALHPDPEPDRPAGAGDGRDPDDPTLGDSGDSDEQVPAPAVLFDGLGAGAAFGTLVHSALEAVDFTADLDGQLTDVLDVPWSSVAGDDVPRLVRAIAASIRTPLGTAFGGLALEHLASGDRLDELDFELPLGDRTDPSRLTVPARAIGEVLVAHLDADDDLAPWAARLAGGLIDVEVGGHLTGSIDLVLRMPGPTGGHRYSVVDYKTNRLGNWSSPDSLSNYHPDRLPAAMEDHDYPLQAVLYSVALHRYLRWRLPGYRPEVHLGPVGYLFVRGMVGPPSVLADGRCHGVFAWSVPPAAVEELSDLLHGSRGTVASASGQPAGSGAGSGSGAES